MPRFSAHIGYLFKELPLRERFAAARRHGFDAVEHPEPYDIPAAEMRALLDDNGLAFAQLALTMGDAARGEKGLACLPGRQADFRAALERAIHYAAAIGCPLVHAGAGVVPEGADPSAVREAYLDNLALAADRCAAAGLGLLIEAINSKTIPGFYLDRPDTAIEVLDLIDRRNAFLLLDTFHAVMCDLDPTAFAQAHLGRIAQVHLADAPGRHEPGTGAIDFAGFFAALDARGFAGFAGCEYIPSGRTEDGLGWLAEAKARSARG